MSFQTHKKTQDANTVYDTYTNKSIKALNENSFDIAKKWAQKAIQLDKLKDTGYQLLALSYDRSGDLLQAYKTIIQNPSIQRSTHYNLYAGELAANTKHFQDAISTFQHIEKNNSDNLQALNGLFYCYNMLDDDINKYITLKKIKNLTALNENQVNHYLNSIQRINILNFFEEVLLEIDDIISNTTTDTRPAAYTICNLLIKQIPELTTGLTYSTDNNIYHYSLLWSILSKVCIQNIAIDQFVMQARKNILLQVLQQGEIADNLLNVSKSIAEQNYLNEYIHYIASDEKEIIAGLIQIIEIGANNPDWKPADSEAIFIILLMYMPLKELSFYATLANFPLEQWPASIANLAKKTLFNPILEIEVGSNTPQLTKISDDTPALVKAQYEENPYPRWDYAYVPVQSSIGNYIQCLHPSLLLDNFWFTENINILIAGCGTGKQAIERGMAFPNSKITAFDISLRSLGYAQLKYKELALRNIDFYHGDILELDETCGTFDYIECCGVLHHLQDPLAGWKKLIARLNSNGLMRIDLYSKTARSEIIERKNNIEELNIDTSPDNLKIFRQAIINQNTDKNLFLFRDFYNTSEFRDLLFHPQERQYTLPEIKDILLQLNLTFVALHVTRDQQAVFRSVYPAGDIQDLELWSDVELKNPSVFSGMYAFWCKKIMPSRNG